MTKKEREKVWAIITELSDTRNEYKEAGKQEFASIAYAELQGAIRIAVALDVVEVNYRKEA